MNADVSPMPSLIFKLHDPGDQREQRIVFTLPDVDASLVFRATLPNQDGPGVDKLSAESLYSESLSV
jgi:hypothetical protein